MPRLVQFRSSYWERVGPRIGDSHWERHVLQQLLDPDRELSAGPGDRLTVSITRTVHRRIFSPRGVSTFVSRYRKQVRCVYTGAVFQAHKIDQGLDLTGEIRAVLAQSTGDVVLTSTRGVLDAFAVCLNGSGSEGGEKTCYIKFGAPVACGRV